MHGQTGRGRLQAAAQLAALIWPLVLAPAGAQSLEEVARQPGVPAAMGRDLQTLQQYQGQVQRRLGGASSAPTERDPFQVTPALRNGRSTAASAGRAAATAPVADLAGHDDDDDAWHVEALSLGPQRLAVLVRSAGAAGGSRQRGADRPREPRQGGSGLRQRFVREGDSLDMPDGRSYRVLRIDREGVLVQGHGAETDSLRIR